MVTVRFILNQVPVSAAIVPGTLSIDLLRDHFRLTGTKRGCDTGQCGACTILLNGKPERSCCLPAERLENGSVLTIEGLSAPGEPLHPLQRSFWETGAVQCGFCTPGMIMAAYGLLLRNPDPSRTDIRHALQGHLCRCTGYLPIEEAVLRAAGLNTPENPPADGVGSSVPRVDGRDKVTGASRFAADYYLPGMLHGAVVWSPEPCARIHSVHLDAAKAVPGVEKILTWRDLPGENGVGRWRCDRPLLADGRVRFAGDPVALVLADHRATAQHAADLIRITLEPEPGVYDIQTALEGSITVHSGGNIVSENTIRRESKTGRPANGRTVNGTFQTQFVDHGVMEPEAAIAYRDENDVLTVIGPSQNVFLDRMELMRVLNIPIRNMDRIRVIKAETGGAFGKREDILVQPLAALGCAVTGKPVKIVLSRRESMMATTKRHPMTADYETELDADGQIHGHTIRIAADTGAYASWAPNILRKATVHAAGPYVVPNLHVTSRSVYTNSAFSGAMRGFGATQAILGIERQMDRLAEAAGMDPLDYRLRHALHPGDSTGTGQPVPGACGLRDLLEVAADAFQWRGRAGGAVRGTDLAVGYGIAGAFYGIGYGNSILDRSQVILSLESNGRLVLKTGAVDYGQGSTTVFAQLVTESLGVRPGDLTILTADTGLTPDSGSTVASRQTFTTGQAVIKACQALLQRLNSLDPGFNDVCGTGLTARSSHGFCMKDIAGRLDRNVFPVTVKARHVTPTEEMDANTGQGSIYQTYAFAAACAEVAVDRRTGNVRIQRVCSVHDAGRIVNPVLARSQVTGGVVMAAGAVLTEDYRVCRGVPETCDFTRYHLPRFGVVPEIDVRFVEKEDPFGPFGAKGLGEPAMLAAGPAIVNAVADATGLDIQRIPISSTHLLAALKR